MNELAPYMSLGTQMVAVIAAFGAIGWALDYWFESKPLWLVIFLIVGSIAGLTGFLRKALQGVGKQSQSK